MGQERAAAQAPRLRAAHRASPPRAEPGRFWAGKRQGTVHGNPEMQLGHLQELFQVWASCLVPVLSRCPAGHGVTVGEGWAAGEQRFPLVG